MNAPGPARCARARQALEQEARSAGKIDLYLALQPFLIEPPDASEYAALAERLALRRNTLAVAVHRLRQRLQQLVRAELAETVTDGNEVDAELQAMRRSLSL